MIRRAIEKVPAAIGKLTGWYMAWWVFALWSLACIFIGVALMWLAAVPVCKAAMS